jgi:hypothetical protein
LANARVSYHAHGETLIAVTSRERVRWAQGAPRRTQCRQHNGSTCSRRGNARGRPVD